MKMIIGVENTFEADYMYVTLCNLIETLGNELYIYKVEPCNIHFDSAFIHNEALLLFLFDSCIKETIR